jgi:hypothetical protein
MLELIFVIVILGIVASIGSQMIVQAYQAYLMQRAVHRAGVKTELAVNLLANRLAERIDRSLIARKPGQTGNVFATDLYPAGDVPIDKVDIFTMLEWIGYDHDSFNLRNQPAWSGYCDVNASSFSTLNTPSSELSKLALTSSYYLGSDNPAIVFSGHPNYKDAGGNYEATCMYSNAGCIFPVAASSGNTNLPFQAGGDRTPGQMLYTESYRLANSAFAVVATNEHNISGTKTWDMELRYGYQPWNGENYKDDADSSLLLRNVSVFRFRKEANSIRIKLCSVEKIAIGNTISLCKEKAVIR